VKVENQKRYYQKIGTKTIVKTQKGRVVKKPIRLGID